MRLQETKLVWVPYGTIQPQLSLLVSTGCGQCREVSLDSNWWKFLRTSLLVMTPSFDLSWCNLMTQYPDPPGQRMHDRSPTGRVKDTQLDLHLGPADVNMWNDLPESVVRAPSINNFMSRLNAYWEHLESVYIPSCQSWSFTDFWHTYQWHACHWNCLSILEWWSGLSQGLKHLQRQSSKFKVSETSSLLIY